MESITFINEDVPWELYVLQIMKIFLWENLKETLNINLFKHFQIFIVDLLMISIYSGMEAKHNY